MIKDADSKPKLRELSQKQLEMFMAYQADYVNKHWPPLRRLESMRPERVIIPPSRPNTPVESDEPTKQRVGFA